MSMYTRSQRHADTSSNSVDAHPKQRRAKAPKRKSRKNKYTTAIISDREPAKAANRQQTPVHVSKRRIKAVIELLDQPKARAQRPANHARKNCVYARQKEHDSSTAPDACNPCDSAPLVVHNVRQAVLQRDWNAAAGLLVALIRSGKRCYTSYIKEMSFMVFMACKNLGHEDLLHDFIRIGFTQVPLDRDMGDFDMWFLKSESASRFGANT